MSYSKSIDRRTVLRGFGATLVLPMLEIMTGKTQAATQGGKDPGRLACFYIPGAINHYNWYPEGKGFDTSQEKPMSRCKSTATSFLFSPVCLTSKVALAGTSIPTTS